MKSDNGNSDPIVGLGFFIMVVSACFCGSAAIKILATDFNRSIEVKPQPVQVTENHCLLWCHAGQSGEGQ